MARKERFAALRASPRKTTDNLSPITGPAYVPLYLELVFNANNTRRGWVNVSLAIRTPFDLLQDGRLS